MTKKDFELLADWISTDMAKAFGTDTSLESYVFRLANVLEGRYPSFKREKFIARALAGRRNVL